MSNNLTSNNPSSYLGVKATRPPQMIIMQRAPTQNDVIGYVLGTQWLQYDPDNPADAVQYVLSSVEQRVATWVPLNQGGDDPTLTNHAVAIGTGVPGFRSATTVPTVGMPLVSTGANSDPAFGLATVSGGGTGLADCDPYSVYCGGTTGEGPLQQVAGLGTAGQVLTSNGNGVLPTWQNGGAGGSSGGPIAVQVFTSGAGNYTPTAGMASCVVEIVGGGAGGSTATGGVIGGNGGGGGAYSRKFYLAAGIGANQPYSIGAGGATDANGGDTTFGAGGTLITAGGGLASVAAIDPGIGGVATGGDVNTEGGAGGIGIQSGAVANGDFGGFGGSSHYGGGAAARGNSSGVGNDGVDYGSGGGGGVDLTAAGSQAGGEGNGGICIITEYGPYGILPPVTGTTINVIVYDTPGAGVYTPTAGMDQVMVECVGGSGGTDGTRPGIGNPAASGSGGYVKKLFDAATIGASQPFVVGAAGVAGTQTIAPTDGGDTTFGSGGILLTAGGSTSIVTPTCQGGKGGIATGGVINIAGGNGTLHQPATYNNQPVFFSTIGGSNPLGVGASTYSAGITIGTLQGNKGTGYGAGSNNSFSQGANTIDGVDGSAGVIILTEYIS